MVTTRSEPWGVVDRANEYDTGMRVEEGEKTSVDDEYCSSAFYVLGGLLVLMETPSSYVDEVEIKLEGGP